MSSAPSPIGDHALESLKVIRDAMERAGAFTAVPGWSTVAVGLTALAAAPIAAGASDGRRWLAVWLVEGACAVAISGAFVAIPTIKRSESAFRMPHIASIGSPPVETAPSLPPVLPIYASVSNSTPSG